MTAAPEQQTPATIYDPGWCSKRDAMRILNKSDATIERLITQAKVVSKMVKRDGRKAERVFSVQSLEELKSQLNAPPRPSSEIAVRPKQLDPTVILQLIQERQDEVVRALISAADHRIAAEQQSRKLWLTVKEACEYSGLSKRALLCAIAEEKVINQPFGRRGSTLIQRASLEAYVG